MTAMHRPEPLPANPTDWIVEDIPAGTFRVNRAALTDEAIFRDEMRSIFDRCWLYVGHTSEIPKPGDFRARDVGNRPLVFWHGHDGVKRVFYNTCRHRGALVCRVPDGNSNSMNCFYHAWTYGSTGALNGLPGEEAYGPTFDRASMSLLSPAKVDSYRGFVFACFDPEPSTCAPTSRARWTTSTWSPTRPRRWRSRRGRTSTRRTPTGSCMWRTASTATTCCRCI